VGNLQAQEMANALPLEQALAWHLQANHYPPIPKSMVLPCSEAINAYWEDDLERAIALPEGVYYRGKPFASAGAIIINHHLEAWCDDEQD
jgi:hypothetical protein